MGRGRQGKKVAGKRRAAAESAVMPTKEGSFVGADLKGAGASAAPVGGGTSGELKCDVSNSAVEAAVYLRQQEGADFQDADWKLVQQQVEAAGMRAPITHFFRSVPDLSAQNPLLIRGLCHAVALESPYSVESDQKMNSEQARHLFLSVMEAWLRKFTPNHYVNDDEEELWKCESRRREYLRRHGYDPEVLERTGHEKAVAPKALGAVAMSQLDAAALRRVENAAAHMECELSGGVGWYQQLGLRRAGFYGGASSSCVGVRCYPAAVPNCPVTRTFAYRDAFQEENTKLWCGFTPSKNSYFSCDCAAKESSSPEDGVKKCCSSCYSRYQMHWQFLQVTGSQVREAELAVFTAARALDDTIVDSPVSCPKCQIDFSDCECSHGPSVTEVLMTSLAYILCKTYVGAFKMKVDASKMLSDFEHLEPGSKESVFNFKYQTLENSAINCMGILDSSNAVLKSYTALLQRMFLFRHGGEEDEKPTRKHQLREERLQGEGLVFSARPPVPEGTVNHLATLACYDLMGLFAAVVRSAMDGGEEDSSPAEESQIDELYEHLRDLQSTCTEGFFKEVKDLKSPDRHSLLAAEVTHNFHRLDSFRAFEDYRDHLAYEVNLWEAAKAAVQAIGAATKAIADQMLRISGKGYYLDETTCIEMTSQCYELQCNLDDIASDIVKHSQAMNQAGAKMRKQDGGVDDDDVSDRTKAVLNEMSNIKNKCTFCGAVPTSIPHAKKKKKNRKGRRDPALREWEGLKDCGGCRGAASVCSQDCWEDYRKLHDLICRRRSKYSEPSEILLRMEPEDFLEVRAQMDAPLNPYFERDLLARLGDRQAQFEREVAPVLAEVDLARQSANAVGNHLDQEWKMNEWRLWRRVPAADFELDHEVAESEASEPKSECADEDVVVSEYPLRWPKMPKLGDEEEAVDAVPPRFEQRDWDELEGLAEMKEKKVAKNTKKVVKVKMVFDEMTVEKVAKAAKAKTLSELEKVAKAAKAKMLSELEKVTKAAKAKTLSELEKATVEVEEQQVVPAKEQVVRADDELTETEIYSGMKSGAADSLSRSESADGNVAAAIVPEAPERGSSSPLSVVEEEPEAVEEEALGEEEEVSFRKRNSTEETESVDSGSWSTVTPDSEEVEEEENKSDVSNGGKDTDSGKEEEKNAE